MEFIIQKPKSEDVPGIQQVFYKTWVATYPNKEFNIAIEDLEYRYSKLLSEESVEKRKKQLETMGDNEMFLIAKSDNKVVGVYYAIKDDTHNQLQAIYVLPGYQRNGIGKAFWDKAKDFFDFKKNTFVNVATYNEKAINFYKSLGFIDTGRRFTEERFKMRNGAILPELEMMIKAK